MKRDDSIFWSLWLLGLTGFLIYVTFFAIYITPLNVLWISILLISTSIAIDFLSTSHLGFLGGTFAAILLSFTSIRLPLGHAFVVSVLGYVLWRFSLIIAAGWLDNLIDNSQNSKLDGISLIGVQEGFTFVRSNRKWKISNLKSINSIPNSRSIKLISIFSSCKISGRQLKMLNIQPPKSHELFATITIDGKCYRILGGINIIKLQNNFSEQ